MSLNSTDKQVDVWDADIRGFLVRVFPSGVKSFRYSYRFEGARRTYTIGKFGELTVVEARELARVAASKVKSGCDIHAEKIASKVVSLVELELAPSIPTLREFIEGRYKSWRETNMKGSAGTITSLKKNFKFILERQLDSIELVEIEDWRIARLELGISKSTVNRNVADLRAVFSKAVEWKVIKESPLKDLKDLKTDKTMLVRYLDERERASLRAALIERDVKLRAERISGNKWRAYRHKALLPVVAEDEYADYMHPMILLSINTGLRQGELFALNWEDVNFRDRMLTVRGDNTKSHQTRYIPLNNESVNTLEVWQRQNGGICSGLIFHSTVTGEEFDNVRKSWEGIKRLAGIANFRWHDMRHHFASMLVMASVDLNTVRELLGHADIKTTLRYAHLAPHHKARAVDLICN